MRFRNWFAHNIREGSLPGMSLLVAENQDLIQQGYRKITAKYGQHAGKPVWWKQGQPLIPVGQETPVPQAQRPAQTPPSTIATGSRADAIKALRASLGQSPAPTPATPSAIANRSDTSVTSPASVAPASPVTKNGIPGRLSPEHENDYNRAITKTFLGEDENVPHGQKKNVVINALAGTGKTTMLKHLASYKKPGEEWLYLVFNNKNASEANEAGSAFREHGIKAMTSHSFLGQVLKQNSARGMIPHTELMGDDDEGAKKDKIGELIEHNTWIERRATYDYRIQRFLIFPFKMAVKKLADLGKHFAVDPNDGNAGQKLMEIIDKYQIDTTLTENLEFPLRQDRDRNYTDEIINTTIELMEMSLPGKSPDPTYNTVRDHNDTLWYAALHAEQIAWPKYDVVLADEIQDFNRCQLIMLKKLSDAGARVIAVGDPNQAIYMFRGADADAFNHLQTMLNADARGATSHDLPVNFRCAQEIVDYANAKTHVKNLIAGAKDKQTGQPLRGMVTEDKTYDNSMSQIGQEWEQNQGKLNQETAILCRNNAPLVSTALSLMRQGIDFQIIGRDLSKELKRFVNKVVNVFGESQQSAGYGRFSSGRGSGGKNKIIPIERLGAALASYVEKKGMEWNNLANKQSEVKEMRDTEEALVGVLNYLQEFGFKDPRLGMQLTNSTDFIRYLETKFGGLDVQEKAADAKKYNQLDKRNFVTLSTGHRSKGLEFDRVFIVRNDLYEDPKAKTPAELQQERNGQYVAYTRAKKELHVLNDGQPGSSNKQKKRPGLGHGLT